MDKRTTRVGNCHQFLEMSSEFELREYRIEILELRRLQSATSATSSNRF